MDENFVGLNKNNNPDLVNKTKQEIVLRNREYLKINDVTDVVSFDENGVILESGFGSISVDGAELRVTRLATGSGEIEIEGKIGGVVFFEARESLKKRAFSGGEEHDNLRYGAVVADIFRLAGHRRRARGAV